MHRLFYHTYTFFQRNKLWGLSVLLFIVVLLGWVASSLHFNEEVSELIPANEKNKLVQQVLNTTDFSDKIVVNIYSEKSNNEAEMMQVAKKFLQNFQGKDSVFIARVQGKVKPEVAGETYDFVYQHLPLFLDHNDYNTLKLRFNKDSVADRLAQDYQTLTSPAGLFAKKYLRKDPLQLVPLGLKKLKALQLGTHFELYENFLFSPSHQNVLLFISPKKNLHENQKEQFVDKLYAFSHQLNSTYANTKIHLLGPMLYEVANARQIKKDIQLTLSIALGILLVVFIVFYRKIYIPFILFMPTLFGALTALAFLKLIQVEVSLIALGIGSVLVGISLDYALHILTHYRNHNDPKKLYRDVTVPVIMSSLTTALAFLCLVLLKSKALHDLGVFAAVSVLASALFSLLLIPHFYKNSFKLFQLAKKLPFFPHFLSFFASGSPEHSGLCNSKKPSIGLKMPNFRYNPKSLNEFKAKVSSSIKKPTFLDRLATYSFHTNKFVLGGLMLLFIGSLFYFYRVKFNNNLSSLNYQPTALKKAERLLDKIGGQGSKSVYVVAYGKTLAEALTQNEHTFQPLKKAKSTGEVQGFSSVGGMILSKVSQRGKLKQWRDFFSTYQQKKIQKTLKGAGAKLGFNSTAFQPFYNELARDFTTMTLTDFQKFPPLFVEDFIQTSENKELVTVSSVVKIKNTKRSAFLKKIGTQKNVLAIDREALNESLLANLHQQFFRLIGYSLATIFLILLLFYRSLKRSVITLSPILITWVVTLGVMALFHLQFNIFNSIVSTFIFGLGIDYSIFMTNGLQQESRSGKTTLPTYKTSVLLSMLTTLLGIGVLVFAKHPALQSVALVSIIGILTAGLVSFSLQPFLWKLVVNYFR